MKNFAFSDNFHQMIYIIPAPFSPVPRPLYPRSPLPATRPSTIAPSTTAPAPFTPDTPPPRPPAPNYSDLLSISRLIVRSWIIISGTRHETLTK